MAARWQDSRFLLPMVLLVLAASAMASDPESVGAYALASWVGVVFLDAIWPPRWQIQSVRTHDSAYFRGLLRVCAVLQLVLHMLALVLACRGSWLAALSLALCMGLLSGTVGQSAAHELGHSPVKSDKLLARVLMSTMGYPQFMVEHYRGHHPSAATWDDPTSAHEGESFWRFLPRSIVGEFESARILEGHRLAQRHLTWLQSPLIWASGGIAALLLGLVLTFGWTGLLYWLVQCSVAMVLLEAINYIEHYGLYRDSLHGFHLPFAKSHAWNACAPVSGALLFDRSSHSEHHLSPWKPYGMSEVNQAPTLPTGYAGCMVLAMLPMVWFAFMHSRLVDLQRLADAFESECGSSDGGQQ